MASLKSIHERLVRRLCVNYVAYMGQTGMTDAWLEGYFQAKKDVEGFLDQLKIYEPFYDEEYDSK
jgi:hypothetical protein